MAGEFGTTLKRLREAAGLSQMGLAVAAGLNLFTVAKLEQGVREPTWATVQALAKALGVSCEAFVAKDAPADEPSPPPEPKRKPRKKGGEQ
jgi:transcriptional regulator with XRE-family HTH domain